MRHLRTFPFLASCTESARWWRHMVTLLELLARDTREADNQKECVQCESTTVDDVRISGREDLMYTWNLFMFSRV
jgi:hypothetical protein